MPWVPGMEPWDDPDDTAPAPPDLTVYETDPEILGVLYGPDGEPLSILTDRPVIPFGYQPPSQETSP